MSRNTQQLRIFGDFKAIRSTFEYTGFGVQQDNAPVHKSEVVRNFLAQEQWEVLDWPAYSPDLNPIENIWAIFKKKLARSDCYLGEFRRKGYGSVEQHKP